MEETKAPNAREQGLDDALALKMLLQLQQRNQAKEDQACTMVPLDDILKGPGHVARKLILEAKNRPSDPIAFNAEQVLVISLCVWPLEQAWRHHAKKMDSSLGNRGTNLRWQLPNDLGLPRIVIIGGGGCGKTTIMQSVVVPVLRAFFQKVVLTAPSNRAARGFDATAKTLHSIAGIRPQDSMRISNLHIKSDQMRKRMLANQTHAGAWVHDEALQTSASLLHAAALRTTFARKEEYKLVSAAYARPNEIFGRISFLALCGDHLQLPPVPKSSGLLASLEGTSDEHKAGASMFNNVQYLFEMETMKRFKDQTLISILKKMRQRKGAKLSQEEWRAPKDTEVDASKVKADPGAFLDETLGWYESCYLWSVTSMACYSRAMASARHHKETLFFCQAVDFSEQVANGDHDVYRRMLEVPSVAQTGRLPGMVLLHIGMRVRITTQVLPPWAVQDSTGTIMEIHASLGDQQHFKAVAPPDSQRPSEWRLAELPRAVYVKLDNCDREFMPARVCEQHRQCGLADDCDACRAFGGWVLIEPMTRTWTFTDPETGAQIKVKRSQLALMPAEACSLYALQGATCDPGLIAHFVMPNRADNEQKWLQIYVFLSRVRSLKNLRSVGLTAKIRGIIEGGPPDMLADNFERLFRNKIRQTKDAATAANKALGWESLLASTHEEE